MPNMWLHGDNSYVHAPWTFTSNKKLGIINTMKNIRFYFGFDASLKNLFMRDGSKNLGLKTHDWHKCIKVTLCNIILIGGTIMKL